MGPGGARPELAGVFRDVSCTLVDVTLGGDGSCARLLVSGDETLCDLWRKSGRDGVYCVGTNIRTNEAAAIAAVRPFIELPMENSL
jgi:hypothetical protein